MNSALAAVGGAMVYFSERDVLLKDGIVEGPAGTFDLNHVVGIESKPPVLLLVLMGGIACAALLLSVSGHGWEIAVGLGMAALCCLVFLHGCQNQYVYVRTVSGLRSLGTEMTPKQRRELMDAFNQAKRGVGAAE